MKLVQWGEEHMAKFGINKHLQVHCKLTTLRNIWQQMFQALANPMEKRMGPV